MSGFASAYKKPFIVPSGPTGPHDALGFVHGIFDEPLLDELTWCLTYPHDKGVRSHRWRYGRALPDDWKTGNPMQHYCVSALSNGEGHGFLSRKDADWGGLKMVLLDDIYQKVQPPTLEPTFKIETSRVEKHSEQWGYVFDRLMTDRALATTIVNSLRNSTATDRGGQLLTRVARLPGSLPFEKTEQAALIDYSTRRFDPATILDLLGISPAKPSTPYKPRAAEGEFLGDPVLEWLIENGHVLSGPGHDGVYAVLCPWVHASGDNTGTKYRPATAADVNRWWHCHHGSCAHRKTPDFLSWVRDCGGPDAVRYNNQQRRMT